MCVITATELKQNLDKYIEMSEREDVLVKEDGRIVTMLTSPGLRESAADDFLSLFGKYEAIAYERLLDERELSR